LITCKKRTVYYKYTKYSITGYVSKCYQYEKIKTIINRLEKKEGKHRALVN